MAIIEITHTITKLTSVTALRLIFHKYIKAARFDVVIDTVNSTISDEMISKHVNMSVTIKTTKSDTHIDVTPASHIFKYCS